VALCPCGSGVEALTCCEVIISGGTRARTAVELMRARYTAFVTGRMNGAFVRDTTARETRSTDAGAASPQIGGLGLEVRSVTAGGQQDQTGTVEFVARLLVQGRNETHHEISRFRREAGQWVYVDGRFPATAKTGRNDPCPCGSGKKFKQCCGP
jgi:SEC-C motif-containing protein